MDPIHAKINKASKEVRMDPHLREGFGRTLAVMVDGPTVAPATSLFRFPRSFAWATAAVLVAVSGASVTLASTRSVPGDPLYPAKVSVLEPVERALAFSAEAEGEVAVRHLERRFREAAELSAQGSYDQHDESLAALVARDRAVIDGEGQEAARTKFETMAVAYAPVFRTKGIKTFAFAKAMRLGVTEDEVSDELAGAAAREQIARVKRGRDTNLSAKYSARFKEADRLAAAAQVELDQGSFKTALQLSGLAAQIANEAEIFSAISASSSTSTAATSSTSTSATSSTSTGSVQGTSTQGRPSSSILRKLFPGN